MASKKRATKSAQSTFDYEELDRTVSLCDVVGIKDELEEAFITYAKTDNHRKLPDVRDGLKPVHRRIMYAMSRAGSSPTSRYVKTMKFIGDTMGSFHPHGDAGIKDAFTTITYPFDKQPVRFNLPLVDGQGNWGNLEDGPAAPRYTEARVAHSGHLMLGYHPGSTTSELDEESVSFVRTYDETDVEPEVLPALYPGFLVNNIEGIGTPIKSTTASHNVREAMNLALKMMDVHTPTWDTVKKVMPGPDMPCDCDIFIETEDGVPTYYRDGKGSFVMRARYVVSEDGSQVTFTGLPHYVSPEAFTGGVQAMLEDGSLNPKIRVSNTGQDNVCVVIDLNGCDAQDTIDRIISDRRTKAQTTFSVSAYAYVDGRYKRLGVLDAMRHWLKHRKVSIRQRSEYRKAKAEKRLHIVEGYLAAVPIAEEIVAIVRSSEGRSDALERIVDRWDFSSEQADAILSMSISHISKLSASKYEKERNALCAAIDEANKILNDKDYRDSVLKSEIRATRDYLDKVMDTKRRCTLRYESSRMAKPKAPAVAVPEVKMVLSVSPGMWVRVGKRSPKTTAISSEYFTTTTSVTDAQTIEVVTNTGMHYRVDIRDLPEGKPVKIDSVIPDMSADETIVGWCVSHPEDPKRQNDIVLVTQSGQGKRVPYSSYNRSKKKPVSLVSLNPGDHLVAALGTTGKDNDIVCLCDNIGMALFMPVDKLNAKKSLSAGTMALMKLSESSELVWAGIVNENVSLAVRQSDLRKTRSIVTVPISGQPLHNRGVKGVRVLPAITSQAEQVFTIPSDTTHIVLGNGFDDLVDVELSRPEATPGLNVVNKKLGTFTHDYLTSETLSLWGEVRQTREPEDSAADTDEQQ